MKPTRPSNLTLLCVLSYSLIGMVPFGMSGKSFWVFLLVCAGGVPLAYWRAKADQREWSKGNRW